MDNFQIETSFVNLNPLARNPGSAPASTIHFIYMGQPTWDPYRLLAGVQQNIKQLQTPIMGVAINKKSTTTEPPP